jgi:predicted  nucleic acid-binding Zn-ribbon protein
MIAIKTLQKRLDKLEERPTTEPDLVETVLAALEDADLELLQELSSLRESGFNEEQTVSMMGDRYHKAQEALTRCKENYQKVLDTLAAGRTRPWN